MLTWQVDRNAKILFESLGTYFDLQLLWNQNIFCLLPQRRNRCFIFIANKIYLLQCRLLYRDLNIFFVIKFGLSNWSSERHHTERRCCNWTFVFDPSGRLVYYWSFIVSLAFLYNFWVRSIQLHIMGVESIATSLHNLGR